MSQMEEYIMGLSTKHLIKYVTTDKSLHSSKELRFAEGELARRGINVNELNNLKNNENAEGFQAKLMNGEIEKVTIKNDFYRVDEKAKGQYMEEAFGAAGSLHMTRFSNSPFATRHMLESDLDVTTMIMWMAAFAPLVSGLLVGAILKPVGVETISAFLVLFVYDAITCMIDYMVLKKHNYEVGNLWIYAIAFAPAYMLKRMKLLGEKNYYHVVWTLLLVILLLVKP